MNPIISDSISITNIRPDASCAGAFEGQWSATTSEGANDAVIELLAAHGFTLNPIDAISGLFDDEGRDAMSREVASGSVHFKPARGFFTGSNTTTTAMGATDYHGKPTIWTTGRKVTHVTDDGQILPGTIKSIADGLLEIEYPDGESGWEQPATCHPG